jgi:hypothetical protein
LAVLEANHLGVHAAMLTMLLFTRVLAEHFMLYPNPYPKPSDLDKRWHGDSAFPILLNLGGTIEVRRMSLLFGEKKSSVIRTIADIMIVHASRFEHRGAPISKSSQSQQTRYEEWACSQCIESYLAAKRPLLRSPGP